MQLLQNTARVHSLELPEAALFVAATEFQISTGFGDSGDFESIRFQRKDLHTPVILRLHARKDLDAGTVYSRYSWFALSFLAIAHARDTSSALMTEIVLKHQ